MGPPNGRTTGTANNAARTTPAEKGAAEPMIPKEARLSLFPIVMLLESAAKRQLRWACLGHLSEQNNTPELALRTHRRVLGTAFQLVVASRYKAGDVCW